MITFVQVFETLTRGPELHNNVKIVAWLNELRPIGIELPLTL